MAQAQSAKADDHQFRLIDDVVSAARAVNQSAESGRAEGLTYYGPSLGSLAELRQALAQLDALPPF